LGAEVASVSGELASQPEPTTSEPAREIVIIAPRRPSPRHGAGRDAAASHTVEVEDEELARGAEVIPTVRLPPSRPGGLLAEEDYEILEDEAVVPSARVPPWEGVCPPVGVPPSAPAGKNGASARAARPNPVGPVREVEEPAWART